MKTAELKQIALAAIDQKADWLIAFGEDILRHPELGYKETRTAAKVLEAFAVLGLAKPSRHGITGVKAWLKQAQGPCVAIMGELDAVISPQHPFADTVTGAAHACGHHAQLAAMLGCAVGLRAVQEHLAGSVCLMAVPAEEYIEIGWRASLRRERKIQYLGGKQQLIYEGAFDEIDLAMMVHSETDAPTPRVVVNGPSSGFVGKQMRFLGREAHAGGAPWKGINALNAATLAIAAIHANRETFQDEDCVRVHPIITKGGELVNTVPARVEMESYVRAANIAAMKTANETVNRAARGAAYAVGATVELEDMPGYLPMQQNEAMSELFARNAALLPQLSVAQGLVFSGSTDVGDLSQLLPVIQPTVSGFRGALHSKEFTIEDKELAYLVPAKLMAATVIDLLTEEGAAAQKIMKHGARKSKEEYTALWQEFLKEAIP